MKIELGRWKMETAAWLAVLALAAVLITAVIFACRNFQSLELKASLNLQARPSFLPTGNHQPSTEKSE